jgi:hypothetical protein
LEGFSATLTSLRSNITHPRLKCCSLRCGRRLAANRRLEDVDLAV